MKNYVIVKEKHNRGKDEAWCYWFTCPNCSDIEIMDGSNFCSNCGIKLRWSKKLGKEA